VLEENEKIAQARLAAVEVLLSEIFDDSKHLRQAKVNVGKKNLDHLAVMHKELQACAQELDKTKRAYCDEEHSAYDARTKAEDAETK
jgi:hypothetical protein